MGVAQGVSGVGVPLYSFLLNARKCEKIIYLHPHKLLFSIVQTWSLTDVHFYCMLIDSLSPSLVR